MAGKSYKELLAVSCLAGRGNQRERLVDAVVSSLIHISPDRDLPSEIRSDFAQFIGDITSVKTERDEGNIQATIDSLDCPSSNKWHRRSV